MQIKYIMFKLQKNQRWKYIEKSQRGKPTLGIEKKD